MKNKVTTYLLGAAVLGVWGIIIYRVFDTVGEDEGKVYRMAPAARETPVSYSLPDTFRLALNYRDPFTGDLSEPAAVAEEPGAVSAPVAVIPPKPQVNWNEVQYKGFIINPQTRKKVSIIVVRGREQMMEEGQEYQGVKVLKNYRDSVRLAYMGGVKNIKIN